MTSPRLTNEAPQGRPMVRRPMPWIVSRRLAMPTRERSAEDHEAISEIEAAEQAIERRRLARTPGDVDEALR